MWRCGASQILRSSGIATSQELPTRILFAALLFENRDGTRRALKGACVNKSKNGRRRSHGGFVTCARSFESDRTGTQQQINFMTQRHRRRQITAPPGAAAREKSSFRNSGSRMRKRTKPCTGSSTFRAQHSVKTLILVRCSSKRESCGRSLRRRIQPRSGTTRLRATNRAHHHIAAASRKTPRRRNIAHHITTSRHLHITSPHRHIATSPHRHIALWPSRA